MGPPLRVLPYHRDIVGFESIWKILHGVLTLSPLPSSQPRHPRSIPGGSGDGGMRRGADRRGREGGLI